MALAPPGRAATPRPGEIEVRVDKGRASTSGVGEVDADLAVVLPARPTAPLALDAHGFGPFLGEGAQIEDDHTLGIPELLADMEVEFAPNRVVAPSPGADETLQGTAMLSVVHGDGLDALARQVAQEAFDVGAGMLPLLGPVEGGVVPPDEPVEVLEARSQPLSRDLDVGKKFVVGKRAGQSYKNPSLGSPKGFVGKPPPRLEENPSQ